MSLPPETAPPTADTLQEGDDIKALAKGGRTNFFGFLLRLAARLPFLFIAGRWYGAEALGRFAYAVIIVEFVATLATLGLKRGLAEQLSATDRPHVHVVWDGLLMGAIASAVAATVLGAVPELMFPNSGINGLEWLLPLTIFALAWSDIALAALAYRLDIGATVRARSVIEPWTISIAAFGLAFYSLRDGLIIAYVVSMVAALVASIWPLLKSFGWPHGWRPRPAALFMLARRNVPLAAADAIEWGSRRLDIAILGLFFSPVIVGIYYVAQQVASLPQKLKTSFDPILGPVITRNLEAGNRLAVAKQVAQVGFWIIAAQTAVGLALGIPGEGVMGLVGPNFVAGNTALAFLLIAEVVAATAAVSEAALIYVARHLNLWISMGMIGIQIMLSFAIVMIMRDQFALPVLWQAAGPAIALAMALGIASIMKAKLLSRLLGAPVSGWRWPLVWAALAAGVVGYLATRLPEWLELLLGIPAILLVFGAIIWRFGFTSEDRTLFRLKEA
ncbi:lipopolysaccharide biosynthesis protein [Rhizorhabdus wittichii]|uniref:Polysaccharide biosynthesis protein n=2 Tax=Rhizorhabdus wittichii TaxID=160791 RepID=A0A9J9H8L4_RHIWR|nr:lipopolysaccharide biosynthesis protein [Rhizorhabdus wittichii]ABQ66817.1 polysaccharide biosynthesis protein [Rhizorhabdus wittichii RW1]QTH22766.1 lipopolysaccharide biosynthesis protein [Rhizorhabdus wittichii]